MPKWVVDSERVQKNTIIPLILSLVGAALLVFSVSSVNFSSLEPLPIINFGAAIAFFIYSIGRLYAEINIDQDFVELTGSSIIFRETPSFGAGWLPREEEIPFKDIRAIDLVEVRSMLNPDKPSHALLIQPNSGKQIIIASRLSRETIFKIAFAMKGSLTLSTTLNRLLGNNPEIKESIGNIVNIGKGLWNKVQQSRNLNHTDDTEEYK